MVRVFPGNTGDPAAFTEIVIVVRDKLGLTQMVIVGDRGMITAARIGALGGLEDPQRLGDRAARPGHHQAGRRG